VRAGSQRGQASVEQVGLIALAALALVTTLGAMRAPAAGLPERLAEAIVPATGSRAATPVRPEPETTLVERLMAADLGEFLAYRASAARDGRLDYSTDECTAPIAGNAGSTYDFTEACLRHDFGYRNLGRLGLLDARRRSVDERFLADMRGHCLTRAALVLIRCLEWARTYYRAVRGFGWIPALKYE